jgi:AcrR family transcriptional regulator
MATNPTKKSSKANPARASSHDAASRKATRRPKTAPPPPRRRRDPETARAEILDAAERLLSENPPDAIGLKDVAKAAGVSHALVSHYFGTYGELVESVLTQRIRSLRAEALSRLTLPEGVLDASNLLDVVFTALEDPVYVRLSLWALAAERPLGKDSLPFREQGMRIVAEAITARILVDRPALDPAALRARVELSLCLANSAAYGYTVGKEAWLAALARDPSPAFDRSIRQALATMLQRYVLGE